MRRASPAAARAVASLTPRSCRLPRDVRSISPFPKRSRRFGERASELPGGRTPPVEAQAARAGRRPSRIGRSAPGHQPFDGRGGAHSAASSGHRGAARPSCASASTGRAGRPRRSGRGSRRAAAGLALLEEGAHGRILDIGGVEAVEGGIGHDAGRCREGEQRVDAVRHLGGALVAVAHHAGDPGADSRRGRGRRAPPPRRGVRSRRAVGVGEVGMVERRLGAERLQGRREAALVRREGDVVENVDLAVVLAVDMGVGRGDAGLEGAALGLAVEPDAIGMGARRDVVAPEIGALRPGAACDAVADAGAIGRRAPRRRCAAAGPRRPGGRRRAGSTRRPRRAPRRREPPRRRARSGARRRRGTGRRCAASRRRAVGRAARAAGSRSRRRGSRLRPRRAPRRSARAPGRDRRRRCAWSPSPTGRGRCGADARHGPGGSGGRPPRRRARRSPPRRGSAPRADRASSGCAPSAARRGARARARRPAPAV